MSSPGLVALIPLVLSCLLSTQASADRASDLAESAIIVDTHIDVPFRVYRNRDIDVTESTAGGDFDLPRAQAGKLNAAFMSIYIPASVEEAGGATALADELIDLVTGIVSKAPDQLAIASCTDDIYQQKRAGKISLPMGMENGGPLAGDLQNVDHFRQRGIRYITLAHSKSNHISDSSYDENEPWDGLSPFGRDLVPVLNDQGIMIDISHLSDNAAWQVLELSRTPVIASHSSLRHFIPGFHRNMTDEMVIALAKNGGVLQINYGSGFILEASRSWASRRSAEATEYRESNNIGADDPLMVEYYARWTEDNPYPFAGLGDVLDHIDRVVSLAGIDHVGVGSDYDGVGNTLPDGLKDASSYPNLVRGLISRGYSDADIRKILGENLMRVWTTVEKYAETRGYAPVCSGA